MNASYSASLFIVLKSHLFDCTMISFLGDYYTRPKLLPLELLDPPIESIQVDVDSSVSESNSCFVRGRAFEVKSVTKSAKTWDLITVRGR
ncbi:hypothetical protein ACOSP7_006575 [Xanthoceras sorbifolium]